MSKQCDRCGRPPKGREVPVTTVLVPFFLSMTRFEPVEAELGWVELESSSGVTSLCPECASTPLLSQNAEEGDPQ